MYGSDWIQVLFSASFLGRAVQQADMRIGAHHDFAIKLENHPQHAMRCRMLRSEVQGKVAKFRHFDIPVSRFANDPRRDLARLDGHRLIDHPLLLRVIAHFDIAGNREILAERMSDETVVGQNPTQVFVPRENDAEQVESLALEPVHAVPDRVTKAAKENRHPAQSSERAGASSGRSTAGD
jgi:hypothetical protein